MDEIVRNIFEGIVVPVMFIFRNGCMERYVECSEVPFMGKCMS